MRSEIITFEDKDIVLINQSFPKGMVKLQEYLKYIFDQGGDPMEVTIDVANSILFFSARTLYDMFDRHGIHPFVKLEAENWRAVSGKAKIDTLFTNRIDAERAAFFEAFKQLENQLV